MTELEEMYQDFKFEYGFEQCTVCMQPTAIRDTLGFPWCEDHVQHGQVFTWGRRHGYPELDLACMYKIGPGEFAWWGAVIGSATTLAWKGHEDFMWIVLAYIEEFERQKAS